MTYYIFVENGKINGSGECECLTEGFENIEVTEEVYNALIEDADRYIYQDGDIVPNPNYETIKREQERQRKRQEIFDELDALDLKSIRAIRANDEEYIAQYEAQAQELRKQLQEL